MDGFKERRIYKKNHCALHFCPSPLFPHLPYLYMIEESSFSMSAAVFGACFLLLPFCLRVTTVLPLGGKDLLRGGGEVSNGGGVLRVMQEEVGFSFLGR